eukprot:170265_1
MCLVGFIVAPGLHECIVCPICCEYLSLLDQQSIISKLGQVTSSHHMSPHAISHTIHSMKLQVSNYEITQKIKAICYFYFLNISNIEEVMASSIFEHLPFLWTIFKKELHVLEDTDNDKQQEQQEEDD